MDIRKNYAFWCNKNDVKDVCNRVYDLLDKDVVDAKSNTMIIFKNNDCWFFLDIELDDLVCITDFFDASFVEVGCESRKQLRMIKRSNKKYPVAQKAVYKLDYSNDDNLKKSILIPEYFRDRGVCNLLSRNIGIGCTSKKNMDMVREELVSNLDVVTRTGYLLVTSSKLLNCPLPTLSSPVIFITYLEFCCTKSAFSFTKAVRIRSA